MSFSERLQMLLSENNMTKLRLSKAINVSSSLISAWVKSEKKPSFDNLIALSDYFSLSIDYLVCRSNVRSGYDGLSSSESRLLAAFRTLDPIEQGIEIGRLERIVEENNRNIKN